jgi:hypothetical protein
VDLLPLAGEKDQKANVEDEIGLLAKGDALGHELQKYAFLTEE